MKIKRITATFLAVLALILILPLSTFAAEKEYVYITVEKFTLGQGFILEPTRFELAEGETAQSLLEKAIASNKLVIVESQYGDYIDGIKDGDTTEAVIPQYILDEITGEEVTGRAAEGILSGLDYTSQGGWLYAVNNEAAVVAMGACELKANDVVRFFFSVYGYGTEVGFGFDFETNQSDASYIDMANRDELIKIVADKKADDDSADLSGELSLLANLEATQAELDEAADSLSGGDVITPPATGDFRFCILLITLAVSGIGVVVAVKKKVVR